MERVDLVILGATPAEITALTPFPTPVDSVAAADLARDKPNVKIAGNPFSTYIYHDLKLLAGITGLGKVNAAATAAAVLSSFRVRQVWNVGCSGAYAGSGLEIGDVLIADNCICADEGILGKEGPIPTSGLEIPLAVKNGRAFYDCFPLEESFSKQIRAILPAGMYIRSPSGGIRAMEAGESAETAGRFKVIYGPSLTVSMASGDIETAGKRFQRFRALAENMEGSAIAQTCLLFDIPFLEFRGISNMAGVRDKARWDMAVAIANCSAAMMHVLQWTVDGTQEDR